MSNRSASGKRLRASTLDPATVKHRRGLVASNAADAECNASPDAQSETSVIGSGLPAVLGSMAPQHLRRTIEFTLANNWSVISGDVEAPSHQH
ncbi:hypothetical protein M405DRAFT_821453 [Rhizopogon salebrosus TDB-379]|nr:hypothetical protein M405DRAFT_821453 [Rhizopogon salebrosus TDB-379]